MTKLKDKNGREITPGSVLWCDDGYAVVVRQDADGKYYGQLVCDPADSCAGMPGIAYALNGGRDHALIYAPDFSAQTQFLALLHERIAELEERQRGLSKASSARIIINGQIGLVQAIKHDFERIISNATTRTP